MAENGQKPPRRPRTVSVRHPGFPAPKPRPASAPVPAPAPGGTVEAQSRILVETIVSAFTERLRNEAARQGGTLALADIERLATDLDRKRADLEELFRRSFEHYVLARERAAFDHARQYPFDRLIVNTFAELFSPMRQDLDGLHRVTRRVLPGFFMAIDRMLPPDRIEAFQERCRHILRRLSAGDERVMDWTALYGDPEAKELLLDALVAFAPYFEALEKRRNWFLPLVNDNLQPSRDGDDWQLTGIGFYNMTLAMFSQLHTALASESGRAYLEKTYGAAACEALRRQMDSMRDTILAAP